MRVFLDKTTGKWKVGYKGEPKYNSRIEAEKAAMSILCDKLSDLRKKLKDSVANHGK